MMLDTSRRGFITGLISLVASPAIVRVASLMPVKQMLPAPFTYIYGPPTWLGDGVVPVHQVYFKGRMYFIAGNDAIVHWEKLPEGGIWQ